MKINKLLQLLRDNARNSAEGLPTVRVESSETEAHIYLYDVIDAWWGVSAEMLIGALAGLGERTVHLHINSPGGDVFEARAMASAIVAHPGKVVSHIDGLAASAATYLALAASEVRMTDGGMFMIHNSWTMAYGDKSELRKTAGLLEKIDGQILADYARRTGMDSAAMQVLMDAETWFTPQEALDAKFIDAIDPNTKRDAAAAAQAAADRWDLSAYAKAPAKAAKPPVPEPEDAAALDAAVVRQLQANRSRVRSLQIS